MGRYDEDRLLTLPALIEIAPIITREQFRRALDFHALGLEVFVNIHIGLDVNRVA